MYGVGVMSGTSLDGVDTVLIKIEGSGLETKLEVIAYNEYPLSKEIVNKIKKACSKEESRVDEICSLHFELGYIFSEAVLALLKTIEFPLEKIDYIASHGQTIYHNPFSKDNLLPSTLQIGEAAILAYTCNTKVISNFRVMDMAAGGQGAPLVPYSEYILYSKRNKNIALQNIGGIGNVTYLSDSKKLEDMFAFDTGPGNMMINEACRVLFQKSYDNNGEIASKGNIIEPLLAELMKHPFLTLLPPKSTGREEFGEQFVKELVHKYKQEQREDIITTITMFTAKTIAFHYQRDILSKFPLDEVIIGGGGSYNKTLVHFIEKELSPIPVYTQESIGYASNAKEAIAFVIMGNETLHQNSSNVISATGAKEYVVLGQITPKPRV